MSGGFGTSVVLPPRAVVTPRAVQSHGGTAILPLHRHIERYLSERDDIVIRVCCKPGGGATTALQHLAAVLPRTSDLVFVDCGEPIPAKLDYSRTRIIAFARNESLYGVSCFHLLDWTDDDAIEYVLQAHSAVSKSVLNRYLRDQFRSRFEGRPAMITAVLEQLAGDEQLTCTAAFERSVTSLPSADAPAVGEFARYLLIHGTGQLPETFPMQTRKWLRYQPVQLHLARQHLIKALESGEQLEYWVSGHPVKELLQSCAGELQARPTLIDPLKSFAASCSPEYLPTTLSLIALADPSMLPPKGSRDLRHSRLERVRWAGAKLKGADLRLTRFDDADLSQANLCKTLLSGATFDRARLTAAHLSKADASYASFIGSDLSGSIARSAIFSYADCSEAVAKSARMHSACFEYAKLQRAMFTAADLVRAVFRKTKIAECQFIDANLCESTWREMHLAQASFDGADLSHSDLRSCSVADLQCARLNLNCADLSGCDCTGSRLTDATLIYVKLQNAGLAEIDWEGAILRDADFTHASFHMGSTRSGLVGSPIAREGSMTGFYTDEYFEQDYRPPEEIRKANLCGADLRGAIVDGTDWYLVDLRKAKYDTPQAEWFRKCGAILESR